jgi:hypothetical protein
VSNYDWKTAEGKVVKIVNMETSHIRNAMNYIKKKGYGRMESYACGDIDEPYYDEYWFDWEPIWWNMRTELMTRNEWNGGVWL